MVSIVRTKTLARLFSAEGALVEKERLVQALVEQVEYLRGKLGEPTVTVSQAVERPYLERLAIPELEKPIQVHSVSQISQEEDELDAMLQAKVISLNEYEKAKAALNSPDIIE